MNWAASHLANTMELQGSAQNGSFYKQKGWGQKKEVLSKEWIALGKVALLWGKRGIYYADYLTSTYQLIPD